MTALLAAALAAALAAYPALRAGPAADAIASLGIAGVAAVVLTLTTSTKLLPLPLLLLVAELELHHVLEPIPQAVLAAYAGALLLLGELVAWSRSLYGLAVVDRAVVIARSRFLVAAALGASALAALVLGASTARLTGGFGDAAIGTAAAVLLLAAILTATRRVR